MKLLRLLQPSNGIHKRGGGAATRAVWRGSLADGAALDCHSRAVTASTRKYRDELSYWVQIAREGGAGGSEQLFGGPFWEVFRGWQVLRMQELASFLGLADLEALKAWTSSRTSVEIGPGPFPGVATVPWRRAIAVDPLADGYYAERLVPPDAAHVIFLSAPGEVVPLPSGYADIVLAENCLDHVDEPVEVLREIHRLLREDGLLWLLVDLMEYRDHVHPNPFMEERLRRALADAGFMSVKDRVSEHKSHPMAHGEYRGLLKRV